MIHKNMMFGRVAFLTLLFESALSSWHFSLGEECLKVGQLDRRVHQNFAVWSSCSDNQMVTKDNKDTF